MQRRCDIKAPAALRARHDVPLVLGLAQPSPMRLYMSRTQPQLHAAPATPVAMVPPMKRQVDCLPPSQKLLLPGLTAAAQPVKRPPAPALTDIDCRPPTPKLQRLSRAASPSIGIATNPLHRRLSRDRGDAAATLPPVTPGGANSAVPAASAPLDRYQTAVANVAFPTVTATTTPLFQQTLAAAAASVAAKRDAQCSPHEPAAARSQTPTAATGGVSLTSWVRSARCRLAARLRRSFSASRVDVAASSTSTKAASGSASTLAQSDASTPKRLLGRRKRHASLQRLVQRLAASPVATSATVASKHGLTGSACSGSPKAVSGRVLKMLSDGTQIVRVQRARGGKFGFFVAREKNGVFVSRFNDADTQRCYSSAISVGDQILEIEGIPTTAMPLEELHRFISDKRTLLIRLRNCCSW